MIPTLALPGESTPGQLGPISVTPSRRMYVYTRSMSCAGMCSVMQIDRRDPGVHGFVDRVDREPRGHEDQRRVRAGLGDGLRDGVEDGDALDVEPALARSDARDEVRAVVAVAQAVESPLAPGEPLDDEPRVPVDDDRHQYCDFRRLEQDLRVVARHCPRRRAAARAAPSRALLRRPRNRSARATRRAGGSSRRTRPARPRGRLRRAAPSIPPRRTSARATDRAASPPPLAAPR